MLDWSLKLLRKYGFDGYRVDAPLGKEPNWDRGIPYHASATNLGVIRLLERLQKAIKEINPEAVLFCELFGPVFVKSHDLACDYLPFVQTYQLLQHRITPGEWSNWIKDHRLALPEGAVRVCFVETHDTRGFYPPVYGLRGSQLSKAGFAALIMAGFLPMIWSGQEKGQEDFYYDLLKARAGSKAILEGETLYNTVSCSNEWVLNLIRRHNKGIIWGLISLWPEKSTFNIALPVADLRLNIEKSYRFRDLISGQYWNEYDKTLWKTDELDDIYITPQPFKPYFFELSPL